MPIIIRCHSCGFVLYMYDSRKKEPPRSIEVALREWGFKCPVCGSPLSRVPLRVFAGDAGA